MSDDFKKAFGNAMINIVNSEEGLEVLSVLSHIGYQFAESSDYDAERAAQNMLKPASRYLFFRFSLVVFLISNLPLSHSCQIIQ